MALVGGIVYDWLRHRTYIEVLENAQTRIYKIEEIDFCLERKKRILLNLPLMKAGRAPAFCIYSGFTNF